MPWTRALNARGRIERQLNSRRGGGAWMGASQMRCRFAIFLIAGCARVKRAAGDFMPEFAGHDQKVSQRRHIEISSINTRGSLRSADSWKAACWGIPYRCFVGVGLTR